MADVPVPTPEPPVLDRAGLERVLARAAELQAAVGDRPEALSEAQLLDLGREVGIAPEHLRQALAEERARVTIPDDRGASATLLGPAVVSAARTVRGSAATALAALDDWMQRSEAMQVKRRFPDQLVWEPKHDFVSALRRALQVGGRGFHLSSGEVSAIAAAASPDAVHVHLVGDFTEPRTQRTAAVIAAVLAGVMIGVPLMWMAVQASLVLGAALSLVPALALPLGAIALGRRQYRRLLLRAQVALEQALDRLEFGPGKPSPAQALLDVITGPPRLPR